MLVSGEEAMIMERIEIFVDREDYKLWQSVEKQFFDCALVGHARYKKRIQDGVIGIGLGIVISIYLLWDSLSFMRILVMAGFVYFVVKKAMAFFKRFSGEVMEETLHQELKIMRAVLTRARLGHIDAVEVHTSPWVNTRYLLRIKY
jgi:DNA-directed RNA polymerase subunit E'/Rpb7